jgi:hypothetical protein
MRGGATLMPYRLVRRPPAHFEKRHGPGLAQLHLLAEMIDRLDELISHVVSPRRIVKDAKGEIVGGPHPKAPAPVRARQNYPAAKPLSHLVRQKHRQSDRRLH